VSRYGAIDLGSQKVMGLNNIELISDRPIEENLREIAEVKKRFPKQAVIASLMVDSKREVWHDIVKRTEATGCDGLELNFGCPHGMSERGMGAAVGQVPEYTTMITEWVKEAARTPVLIKLTPNCTDVARMAEAAAQGGADGISLINTINSVMGVDLDTFAPRPTVRGLSSHGGYCGPAVKPIALHRCRPAPSGYAFPSAASAAFDLAGCGRVPGAGATSVQVCTAAMHYGSASSKTD
jgi:dihydropyrimidine dehydrogenase (NAD+) subunit PreA